MKNILRLALVALALYVLSYFVLVKRVRGEIMAYGTVPAPAFRGMSFPENISTRFLSVYQPLLILDKAIRPDHWSVTIDPLDDD